ncbi:MAG: hypothetical protein KC620_23215, partial [Myxococcales bacterium]|nr:hypothetical protein [Myxococcales bacterium]
VLSAEHVRSIPDFNPCALVGASEWDLEEFALPVLDEWRRRWWASRAVEPAWIAAVRLTDEDLPSWRLRKASGQALPPDVPFSVGDLREAFEVMGWSVIGQGAAWQRMHHPRHALDLLIPPDSASTSAALCRLALIWYQTSDSSPEVMRGSQRDEAETIAQVWRTLGEPQVAALVEELATWENAGAALVRLRAAGSLADERRTSWGRGSRMPSH